MAGWPHFTVRARLAATMALLSLACPTGAQTTGAQATGDSSPTLLSLDGSAAYPNGTFGEQLASATQSGGSMPVGGSPFRNGPGRRDHWLVGPRWRVTVDGLVLFRDDADVDALIGEVSALPPSSTLPALDYRDNFDHAAGVRVLATGEYPQCEGYELQVGYVGAEKWMAGALWALETIPAASLPASDVDVLQRRQLNYESALHSLEFNFQRSTQGYLKPFAGLRYFSLDETVDDTNNQFTIGALPDPVMVGDMVSSSTTFTRTGVETENNLIGFQGGLRLDMWRPTRRFHLAGSLAAGVYCNIVDRNRVFQSVTSTTTNELVTIDMVDQVQTTTSTAGATSVASTDGTRIAFNTEATLAGVWRLNNAVALRAGYQMLFFSGVELAENLWTAPPPLAPASDDLFLHGWFAGFEYRR